MLQFGFQALLELRDGRSIEAIGREDTSLQSAALKTWTVRVVALANDFATANDYGTMAVVEGREFGLSQTKRQVRIIAWRHLGF